jgi:hypothetical protein
VAVQLRPGHRRLWIADVGERSIEEVTPLPAGGILGANLGWNRLEGSRSFAGEPPAGAVGPVHEYGRDEGISVTGGVVYRGDAIPGLAGRVPLRRPRDGRGVGVPTDGTTVRRARPSSASASSPGTLVSFAEDAVGEVYVVSIGGRRRTASTPP